MRYERSRILKKIPFARLLFSTQLFASPSAVMCAAVNAIGVSSGANKPSAFMPNSKMSDPPIPVAPDEQGLAASSVSSVVQEVKDSEPTPDEILQVKKIWEGINNAKSRPIGDQPRPMISMMNIDLSPGSTPPVVRVSVQTGTILSFMDVSGKEWPISAIVNMSADAIDAQEKPIVGSAGNSMFAKIKRNGATGNLGVFLKDFSTPIVITLLSGQKDSDYRVDFRIPAILRSGSPGGAGGDGATGVNVSKTEWDERLSSALMNITPDGCKSQSTSNKDVSVWQCEKSQSIIRSKGVLLSPAPLDGKKLVASDSTKSYLIPSSPILSMLVNGSVVSVRITNKDN